MSNYDTSSLWETAFVGPEKDRHEAERTYLREQYNRLRLKVEQLVKQIPKDVPGLTVHDITHLDAIWDTASTIAGSEYPINPAEGYVFGAAVLLHDAGMALASYPDGIKGIEQTTEWLDGVAGELRRSGLDPTPQMCLNPSESVRKLVLAQTLRSLHAKRAEQLPNISWNREGAAQEFLIDDPDLRAFYGSIIGRIAASHHLSVSTLPERLYGTTGAIPRIPSQWTVNSLKLACLLRAADAAHIDERRAPRFLRMLVWPNGISAEHWNFQSKLAKPRLEKDLLVITSGPEFNLADADAWWLCFDTIGMIDSELRNCDVLLDNLGLPRFAAKRVSGSESPSALSKVIRTAGWEPVDTAIKVSDVPRLVRMLGGSHLYGNNDAVTLRELIQNAADAIKARRLLENRPLAFGRVRVWTEHETNGWWLVVEDDGVGMSVRTLSGALLDFGKSFWSTDAVHSEFPGLISKGMNPVGRYGIGFFSVFMLGDLVVVTSRRYDAAQEETHTLEFRGGLSIRPILRKSIPSEYSLSGGTRVSVKLKQDPFGKGGLFSGSQPVPNENDTVQRILASICPNVDINLDGGVSSSVSPSIAANDWLTIDGRELLLRVAEKGAWKNEKVLSAYGSCMRPLVGNDGVIDGRACIVASEGYFNVPRGVIAIGGFAATKIEGLGGVLIGDPQTAARTSALPTVNAQTLAGWASEQAELLADSSLSAEEKHGIAGIVLQCGGTVGKLPIVERDGDYLDIEALAVLLREQDSIVVFDGAQVDYDEDQDSCHPRDFKDRFEPDPELFFLDRNRRPMATVDGKPWPACIIEENQRLSYEDVFRRALVEAWGDFEEDIEENLVGITGTREEIKRDVTVFRRCSR